MNTYIGIDLGGTKLLIGEVTEDGRVLHSRSCPTGALTQSQALELICQALDEFLPECGHAVRAIGLGMVGRVTTKRASGWKFPEIERNPLPLERCSPNATVSPASWTTTSAAP